MSNNVNEVQMCVLAYAPRERTRTMLKGAFPKRKTRVTTVRSSDEFEQVFKQHLVDAAIVDLCQATEGAWSAAKLALEFPSTAFFGIVPMRAADGPVLARCASLEFADVLVESVDDHVINSRAAGARPGHSLGRRPGGPRPPQGTPVPAPLQNRIRVSVRRPVRLANNR